MAMFETNILYYNNFDVCDYCSRSFNICYDCQTYINRGRKPILSVSNKMSQLYYQYYLVSLKDFTSIEEVVITRVYLVITILKSKINNSFNPGVYKGIYGYSVLLLQNPRPLLILLPLETTSMNNIIQVVWVGITLPKPK